MSAKGQTSMRMFFGAETPDAKKAKRTGLTSLSFAGDRRKKPTGTSAFGLIYQSLLLLTITVSKVDFTFLETGERGHPLTFDGSEDVHVHVHVRVRVRVHVRVRVRVRVHVHVRFFSAILEPHSPVWRFFFGHSRAPIASWRFFFEGLF